MSPEILRQIVEGNFDFHVSTGLSGKKGPLSDLASSMPVDGKPSLGDVDTLVSGFSKDQDRAPQAGNEALRCLDSAINEAPENSYSAGVQTP